MREYIIEGADWAIDFTGESMFKGCEEIVRCRDCKYYDGVIHACERFDSIKQDNVSYVFDDGFCAWGERKEVGE